MPDLILDQRAIEIRCSRQSGNCRKLIAICYEIPLAHRERLGGVLIVVPAGSSSKPLWHVVPADFSGYVLGTGPLPCPKHGGPRWPPGPNFEGVPLPPVCSDLREPYEAFLASGKRRKVQEFLWPY
jgi:hypothetical protein